MKYDYDLFTIGAGSGGVRASRLAASHGARVALAEEKELGGTCVNLGCIPKKLMSYAAHYRDDFEDAVAYGWKSAVPSHDWATLITNKNKEIARLNGIYQRLLEAAGATILPGRAKLVDAHTVDVGGKTYTAEHILVATGSSPVVPEAPGSEYAVTSDAMFHLGQRPDRVLVVGGGYIGVEFASILNALGSKVTLLHRRKHVLRGFDDDVRVTLTGQLGARGVDLRMEQTVDAFEKTADGIRAKCSSGETLEVDLVLCAVGRRPNTGGIGLEELGVQLDDRGAVVVDAHYRSSVKSIFALGDVIDRVTLTPVAISEAIAFVKTTFQKVPMELDYSNIPSAVFSHPPVATVGLAEGVAVELYGGVDIYQSSFRTLRDTLTGRDEKTMMKLVVETGQDRVVGCHVVGPDAPEIVQGFAVALMCGATKAQFDRTVGIHPTAAEELVTMREPTRRSTPPQGVEP